MRLKALTENQMDVLQGLYDLCEPSDPDDRFWRLMDFGATDASHHSGTAKRLAEKGLIERTDQLRGSITRRRKVWLYRITDAGRFTLEALATTHPQSGKD